jgi:hypothetical protein
MSSTELWDGLPSVSRTVLARVFPAELSAELLGEFADELQAVLPTEPSTVLCPVLSGLLLDELPTVLPGTFLDVPLPTLWVQLATCLSLTFVAAVDSAQAEADTWTL